MSKKKLKDTVNGVSQIPATHEAQANRIIRNYTIAATGSGIVPIPLISAAAVTGIQVLLIKDLCRLFEVPFNDRQVQVIVNSTLGSVATRIVAMAATIIPGISAPTKGLSGAAISGLFVATVGEFYKVHFQSGGTLEDASINDLRKYFIEEYKRGDISTNSLSPISMIKRIFG